MSEIISMSCQVVDIVLITLWIYKYDSILQLSRYLIL
jgi:hypothetical protein